MQPLTAAAALLLALPLVASAQSAEERKKDRVTAEPAGGVALSPAEQDVFRQINQFRQRHGREALNVSRDLTQAAEYFAEYMARTGRYGHTADQQRPAQRAEEFGYDYCIVAENIAYQYRSTGFAPQELADRLTEGWTESPTHRANILDREVTETGVALAQAEDSGYWFAVQMFGRPLSKKKEFSLENRTGRRLRYSIDGRSFVLPPRYTRTHERCRPVTMDFGWTKEDEAIDPSDGTRFVLRDGERGTVNVTREGSE